MGRKGLSPKSLLRRSIRDITRSRGHANHNLWLAYSPKIDQDLVFPSDRQFIHWLYFLELNPEVASFDCAPGVIASHDGIESRGTELDAIAVYRNGENEWQEVKAGVVLDPSDESQFAAQRNAAKKFNAAYRIFNDNDLRPIALIAMRWHDLISYAAVIRGEAHTQYQNDLITHMRERTSGSFLMLYEALPHLDPEILIGVMVRMAAKGFITIDVSKKPFGDATRWRYGK